MIVQFGTSRFLQAHVDNPYLDHLLSDIHAHHAAKVVKRMSGFLDWVDGAADAPELRALADRYRG